MTLYSVILSLVVMYTVVVQGYYVWRCQAVPPTSGHLSCTDTFAWSRGCPFMTGTTVHLHVLRLPMSAKDEKGQNSDEDG